MTAFVETDRLVLRRFTADDADLLIELDSDPEVMRFLTGGEPSAPPEVIRERVMPRVVANYERGAIGMLAAHERDSGAFVGWFQLRSDPDGPLDDVELGYRLRRESWGRGYATEGARALLDKAFTDLEVRVAWAETMVVNTASQRVMDKLGMTVTDTSPAPADMHGVEGYEQGGLRYEVTREQWAQR